MKKIDRTLFKDITLLYVEDDPMTLEEISFFLNKYVKKLIVAKNGKEGLALFKEYNPDMVITDIQMPIMDGLEMSKKIFEINPAIPIAVTTAYSDGPYLMKAIELGIDKYIIKPINMMKILAVIQKALNLQKDSSKLNNYGDYI
jgi:YesN/AraC family two-component response regulator